MKKIESYVSEETYQRVVESKIETEKQTGLKISLSQFVEGLIAKGCR
jgi:hypothetical protein